MFPFQTMAFALRRVMVDPCFVPSDDASQKGVTFLTVAVLRASADGQMYAFVLFCELFGNLSCTHLMKAKMVVDDFMDTTMTDNTPLHQ
jgi:hypothetical protein